jgi:hypothetical protein
MTKLQTFIQRACHDVGLSIVVPFGLIMRDGIQVNAQAFLPQLGGPNGMIIVNCYDDLFGTSNELESMGYGYSVLDEPLPSEEYELESFIEIFSDWGWGNVTEAKPDWMN